MVPGTIEDFFADARSGNLPNFALIDPDFKVNDAYPKRSLSLCEAFVASLVKAMAEGPQWNRSLLLVLFDEHGGYYDHVPPPTTVDLRARLPATGFPRAGAGDRAHGARRARWYPRRSSTCRWPPRCAPASASNR